MREIDYDHETQWYNNPRFSIFHALRYFITSQYNKYILISMETIPKMSDYNVQIVCAKNTRLRMVIGYLFDSAPAFGYKAHVDY